MLTLSVRKQEAASGKVPRINPRRDRFARRLSQFEADRTVGLVLAHRGALKNVIAVGRLTRRARLDRRAKKAPAAHAPPGSVTLPVTQTALALGGPSLP